jgi:CAAX protease family protein
MEKATALLDTKLGALFALAFCYGLIYNPLTRFPWTFGAIILAVLGFTYLQEKSLAALHFKKLQWRDLGTIVLVYLSLEIVMDFAVQPLVNQLFPEPVDYTAFDSLKGNTPKFFKYLLYMWLSAAVGEELLFRAFVFAQFRKIIGDQKTVILLLSAVVFSLPHLYQGYAGLMVTFLFGLAFGAIYLKFKNIWINIIVHGLVDTLFLTLAYLDLLSFYS